MKFEDLKLIFTTSQYVELICDETFPKGIKNKLIKFDKNSRSNSFLVRIDEGSSEFAQAYLCQTTSDLALKSSVHHLALRTTGEVESRAGKQ